MESLEFIVREGGTDRAIPFPSNHFTIGSATDCELRFPATQVRPRHAEVFFEADAWWIRDIAGSNAVLVDGMRTLEGALADGALVKIGKLELAVCVCAPPTPEPVPDPEADAELDETRQSAVREQARHALSAEPTSVSSPAIKAIGIAADDVIDHRYRIVARIAAGGMGEVYRAEHIELGKPVAIKVMLSELSRDDEFVGRFKREAIAAGKIGQQNIVDISDFGRTADGRFYFVMELIDGKTLAKHLRTEGAFSPARTVHVGLQAALALAAAHAQGIVHRDLKPENIMLVQRPGQPDFVKVLDFGVAKVTNPGGAAGHTAIGMIVGTPQYMSPEQAAGVPVDARSDIYSLGLILHELLSGHPTFSGETPPMLLAMQITAEPPPLRTPRPVPAALETLIFQMLAKRPEDRPQTMQTVVQLLDRSLTGPAPTPLPVKTTLEAAVTQPAPAVTQPAPAASVPTRASPSLAPVDLTGFTPAARTVTGDLPAQTGIVPRGARTADLRGVREAADDHLEREPSTIEEPPQDVRETDLAAVRSGRGPMIVLGLLALVVLGAAGAWVISSLDQAGQVSPDAGVVLAPVHREPVQPLPHEPLLPPAPAVVKLTVSSQPDKAEVYEGDVLLGNTPLVLQRPSGQLAELTFVLKGFSTVTRKVRFESDNAIGVELERKPVPPVRTPIRKPRPSSGELKDLPD